MPTPILHIPLKREGLALGGFLGFTRVWLWRTGGDRDYKCKICHQEIPARFEHVFLRYLFPDSRGYDHHHLHILCAEREVVPDMLEISHVPFSRLPRKRQRTEVHNPIHRLVPQDIAKRNGRKKNYP